MLKINYPKDKKTFEEGYLEIFENLKANCDRKNHLNWLLFSNIFYQTIKSF